MGLPRSPKRGAASAVPETLFHHCEVSLESVAQGPVSSPGIVNRFLSWDLHCARPELERNWGQRTHMRHVDGTIGLAGVLGFLIDVTAAPPLKSRNMVCAGKPRVLL